MSIDEVVEHIRQSSLFWAPELRAAKLMDFLQTYGMPLYEALKALPDAERDACGVDLIVLKRAEGGAP